GSRAAGPRLIIALASSGLVANPVSSGIPAAAHRSRSAAHDLGTYSSRSISARPPPGTAQARNTPTWQLVIFPAVPVYCRCTPAEHTPDFSNQLPPATSPAAGSPR